MHFLFQTDSLKQISKQEFYDLFSQSPIVAETVNENLQADLLFPKQFEEIKKQYPFIIKAGEPQIFLFDDEKIKDETKTVQEEDRNGRQGGSIRRGKIQIDELNDIDTDISTVTEVPHTEFSTIKLDISSVAFILDRKSGQRKLQTRTESGGNQVGEEAVTTRTDLIETTDSVVRTIRDDDDHSFGEVVAINFTIESSDGSDVTESSFVNDAEVTSTTDSKDNQNIDEIVDKILNVEIFKQGKKGDGNNTLSTHLPSATPTTTTTITTTTDTTSSTSSLSTTTMLTTSKSSTSTATTTTKSATTTLTLNAETTTAFSKASTQHPQRISARERVFKSIGFNRGSVEAKPKNSSFRPKFSSRRPPVAAFSTSTRPTPSSRTTTVSSTTSTPTTRIITSRIDKSDVPEPSSNVASAIPLLSYWIVDHITKDSELSSRLDCLASVPDLLARLVAEERLGTETSHHLIQSSESLAALLVNIISRNEESKNKVDTDSVPEEDNSKDSVHGNDVVRRSRVKIRFV